MPLNYEKETAEDFEEDELGHEKGTFDKPVPYWGSLKMMKDRGFSHVIGNIWFKNTLCFVERIPICDNCGEELTGPTVDVGKGHPRLGEGAHCLKCFERFSKPREF